MSVEYYAVSHKLRRAVAMTDNKGNPINRACWREFLIAYLGVADDEPLALVPEFSVPRGYVQCGGEWGASDCDGCER